MRIFKYLSLLFLLFFIGTIIFILTEKGDVKCSKTIEVSANRITVYEYMNDLKNWETFGSWMQKDNEIKITYSPKTMDAGAKCSWESNFGDGSIQSYVTKQNELIAQKLNIDATELKLYWKFSDSKKGTNIKVICQGKMDLWTKFQSFFHGGINAVVEETIEKSIHKLDKTLQYELKTYTIKVNGVSQRPSGFCLKKVIHCKSGSLVKNIKILLPNLVYFFNKNKLTMAGKPFVFYDCLENDVIQLSVCIPTDKKIFVLPESDVLSGEYEAFTCIKTTLTGDYSHLNEAWEKTKKYCSENNFQENSAGKHQEVYLTTIEENKHPSKWITELYMPVFPKPEIVIPTNNPVPTETISSDSNTTVK